MKTNKMLVIVALFIFSVASFSAIISDMEVYSHKIVKDNWKLQEMYYKLQSKEAISEDDYLKLSNKIDNMVLELSDYIISNLKEGNRKPLEKFNDIYSDLPKETRHFLDPVVEEIHPYLSRGDEELFPGYGYAEPGYYYRRGGEVKTELLSKFWKAEEKYVEKNKRHKFYVELKISTSMQQNAEAGGNIEGFKVKGVYGMEINGEFKQVAEVEFSTKETLKTRCTVMYEKNKVWYELFKAKKSFWDFLPWTELEWKKAGETYLISEEATDTEVIIAPLQGVAMTNPMTNPGSNPTSH